jgi:carbamoyl-phosphate synthase small subunit
MNPTTSRQDSHAPKPDGATGVLVLGNGRIFWGRGIGAKDNAVGEVCFNTGLTGYQETLTDPSFAGQIITFTFPHIGNVGANDEDQENLTPCARGLIIKTDITEPSNWRAVETLGAWLLKHKLVGLSGIDTRELTIHIRDYGAPNGVVAHNAKGEFDIPALVKQAKEWPGLEGMDLAKAVTCPKPYEWMDGEWRKESQTSQFHVVAVDYGAKQNILRCLVNAGCRVTVVPATASADDILRYQPDGVFLSNGPGDPAATGVYAVPSIRGVMDHGIPVFGICLGHQLLALALGGRTAKMPRGHRGANHPVKDLQTGKVEITSQNHGFMVLPETLPANTFVTHISLFDGSNEGFRVKDRPAFSVQYHPEASPGPHDSHYLFQRFTDMILAHKAGQKAA